MNAARPAVYAAAALAGWCAVAWRDSAARPDISDAAGKAPSSAADVKSADTGPATLRAMLKPPAGAAGLARVAVLTQAAPDIDAARGHVLDWPPGAAREFALTLLDARAGVLDVEPLLPASPDPLRRIEEMERMMVAGTFDSVHSIRDIGAWISVDPAAATATILKLTSNRDSFVALAIGTMALSDPAAALELQLQSGVQTAGTGAARAWAKLVTGALPDNNGQPDAQRKFLDRMSPQQQESLFTSLADWMDQDEGPLDGGNKNRTDSLQRSDAALLACCVLQAGKSSGGLRRFFTTLAERYPSAANEARMFIQQCSVLGPSHTAALEAMVAVQLNSISQAGPVTAESLESSLNYWGDRLNSTAVVEQNASVYLPLLARAGEFQQANQLISRFSDANARREALTTILPLWMDKDPAAARAAFNAAPLTALEREEWERHPAFLMNRARSAR